LLLGCQMNLDFTAQTDGLVLISAQSRPEPGSSNFPRPTWLDRLRYLSAIALGRYAFAAGVALSRLAGGRARRASGTA
jgi:hypothetical protein